MRRLLERHWEFAGSDQDIAHEIYHDDAILEFPQSGERFIGKEKFKTNLISYDGAPWMFTVSILQFRGDKVEREYLYIMDGFDAPDWRAPYRETFDKLASLG